jgi:hypothetical protein
MQKRKLGQSGLELSPALALMSIHVSHAARINATSQSFQTATARGRRFVVLMVHVVLSCKRAGDTVLGTERRV